MTDGSTLIVDVETLGENSYALSLPAEDLWVAYEVVRRHIDANGVRHYSQMIEAAMTDDGYSFKFDTGDVFTCASHLNKPTSSTLSDTPAGGSGGGVLVVHSIDDYTTLDKTWQEIHDAALNCVVVLIDEVDQQISPLYLYEVNISGSEYQVAFGDTYYIATSASGYPVYSDLNNEA